MKNKVFKFQNLAVNLFKKEVFLSNGKSFSSKNLSNITYLPQSKNCRGWPIEEKGESTNKGFAKGKISKKWRS